MKLVKLELLRPIEGHSQVRVKNMAKKIEESGIWQRPIVVEEKHMLILDGHHRYEVAKELNFSHILCEFFNYFDPQLEVWSLRADCEVSKDMVIQRAITGSIYPYKTAKHKFPRNVEKCMMPLAKLVKLCGETDSGILEL